jgi:hypothetical protein
MHKEHILSQIETKVLYVIYKKVSLQNVQSVLTI